METEMSSKMDFEQLVRIYVDTDADTHFIVSAVRTSSIAELRELIKATHRHCYPASGDVNIGKLAVPGGDFGYHLADYLCIGQVFDKWEGKVFAEVQSRVKALTNGLGTCKSQALKQRPISTSKNSHLMPDHNNDSQWRGNEAQRNNGEPSENLLGGFEHQILRELSFHGPVGNGVQVNGPQVLQLQKVFKVPKVQKRKSGTVEKASSLIGGVFARVVPEDLQRVDHLLDSQAPFTQPAEEPNVLPVGFSGREDAKALEDRPVSSILKEGIQSEAAGTAIGQPRRKKKKEKVRKGASVVSGGDLDPKNFSLVGDAAEDVGLGTRGVRREREGSECIQRVSKLQKMTEATPSCSTLKIHALDGDLVRKYGNSEKLNKGTLVNGEILASRKESSIKVNPDGEVSTSAVSGLNRKRRKKRELTGSFINSDDNLAAREKEQGAPVGVMSLGLKRVKGNSEKKEKVIDLEASTRADFEQRDSILEDKPKNADNGILEVNAGRQLPGNDAGAKPENLDVVVEVEKQFTVEAVKGKRKKKCKKKGSATSASGIIGSGSTLMGYPVSDRPLLKDVEIPSPYAEPPRVNELSGKDLDEGGRVEVGLVDEDGKQSVTKDHVIVQDCGAENVTPDELDVTPGIEAFCCTKVEQALHQEMAEPVERLEIPLSSSCRLQSGTTQGRGAPSATSMHENSLDKGIEAIKCDTASQNKRQLTPKQAEEKQSQSSKSSRKSKYKSERPKSRSKAFAFSLSEIKAGKQVALTVSATQLRGKEGEEDARSSTTSESSGDGEPTRASQLETGSRLEALDSRKDKHRVSQPSQGFEISERSDGPDNIGVKRRREEEHGEEKIGTLEALPQDLSFKVAPTQAGKAFTGSTTEETSDENDSTEYNYSKKEYHKPEEAHGHSSPNNGTSDAESSGGLETSKPTGSASNATGEPAPLVSRIRAVGCSQTMKRRASGLAADIESKFAQFIDSQNGLDEIMGITLSQRNRSLPVESAKHTTLSEAPSTGTTGSPAAASGSPVEVVFATQDSQVDNVPPTERSLVGLEKFRAADTLQEPLSAKNLTAEFKVPKPVLIGTNSGLTNGGVSHSGVPSKFKLLLEKQNPTLGGSEGVTKTQVESDVSSRQEKKGAEMEKVVPVLTGESDKDVPLAIISKYRNVEPCTLPKERNKGDYNAGTADRQGHTNPMKKEKNPTKNKAVSEFMVVNNTDHLAEQEIENKKNLKRMKDKNSTDMSMDQPESSGAKGEGEVRRSLLNSGAGESENNPSKSTSFVSSKKSMKKQRESKVKREKIETGADEIPSISGLESSGRREKKKKGTAQEGLPNQPDILPETSVDQSALETEELYLKMEKLNNEYWLQKGGSSSKKKDTGRSLSLMSGGKFPTEADDTEVDEVERQMKDSAQIRSEHGEPKLGNTDGNRPLATGEANLAEGRDGHQDSHLLAGTTEASDREEDAILSQGHKEERPGKAGKDRSPDVNETSPPKQTDMRKRIDVFDFQSEDKRPTVKVSKSAEKRTNAKANWMDDVSERAVERVLEDEMLYVAEPEASKKSRKDANPKKWTVRMRGALPSALAASLLQGVDPAAGVRHRFPTGPSRTDGPSLVETSEGVQIDENLIKAESAEDAVTKKATKKPKSDPPKKRTAEAPHTNGVTCCPVGCGKIYSGKTSAWYLHKKVCTGAPPQ